MERHSKHQTSADPTAATAHFGTFTFFQPRQATAFKNVKEPKFTSRTANHNHSVYADTESKTYYPT